MKHPTGWLLVAALLAFSPSVASAQQPAPAEKPEKEPPPPLFPTHTRGFYKTADNVDTIDATPQAPPLETDDPSVPDDGAYEINFSIAADLAGEMRRVDLLQVDANYGVVLKGFGRELPTQVKFEFPLAARKESGNPFQVGIGNAAFGLKFNFYNDEQTGVRVSVYPQVEFGNGNGVEKGLAERGQTVIVPLLVSKELKYVTFVTNAAVEKPVHDPDRRAVGEFGLGAGRAMTRKLALMGEIRYESTFDLKEDRLLSVSAGVIHGVRNAIVYARVGHSLFSDDGSHTYFAFGMKVMMHKQDQAP